MNQFEGGCGGRVESLHRGSHQRTATERKRRRMQWRGGRHRRAVEGGLVGLWASARILKVFFGIARFGNAGCVCAAGKQELEQV
jgi:hypothetical protein